MNKKLIWIGLYLAMMATGAAAGPATEGAKPGEWTMDLVAAKALAAETGLPLLLNFTGSDWSGACRRMDRQVFAQESWQAYATHRLILVWIDFPQDKSLVPEAFAERNTHLSQEFEVGGFPTLVLLDSDGQTRLDAVVASRDATPEQFIAMLEDALLLSDKSIAARKEHLSDEQKATVAEAQAAWDLARQKQRDWTPATDEPTEESISIADGMREEIEQARTALLHLLKSAD